MIKLSSRRRFVEGDDGNDAQDELRHDEPQLDRAQDRLDPQYVRLPEHKVRDAGRPRERERQGDGHGVCAHGQVAPAGQGVAGELERDEEDEEEELGHEHARDVVGQAHVVLLMDQEGGLGDEPGQRAPAAAPETHLEGEKRRKKFR